MSHRTLKIGITGGMGSGKTTVCDLFSALDIPIYNADLAAKRLMTESIEVRQSVMVLLGREAYHTDQQLNTSWIAKKVFNDENLLKELNAIVHPAVFKDLREWFTKQQNVSYALYESALIKPDQTEYELDHLIYVFASENTRMERLVKRDKLEREQLLQRMRKQPDPVSISLDADFIINNENQLLGPQVHLLHRLFTAR